jgi:hypothetical protein|tara:strand:- start:691 stop:798 length:108 start_codon:yes stop_codon:yes gene_type:complete
MKKKLELWAGELKKPGLSDEMKREKRWYDHYFKEN